MGEVVIADGTVTGTGVVLAKRLEQLAEPGGVVVQESVSETVPITRPTSPRFRRGKEDVERPSLLLRYSCRWHLAVGQRTETFPIPHRDTFSLTTYLSNLPSSFFPLFNGKSLWNGHGKAYKTRSTKVLLDFSPQ